MNVLDYSKSWLPKYVNKQGKDSDSLHKWLQAPDFTQQENIKSGIMVEEFIQSLAKNSLVVGNVENNKEISVGNNKYKEADLIFTSGPVLHYREIKTNLNLDSEKISANEKKMKEITESLQENHRDKIIRSDILCPAKLNSGKNYEGLNDFLEVLGYSKLSEDEFKELGKTLGETIGSVLRSETSSKPQNNTSSKRQPYKCKKCHIVGHNSRTCAFVEKEISNDENVASVI